MAFLRDGLHYFHRTMCVVSTKFGPWSSLSLFPLESTLSIVAHSLTLIGPNRGEEEGLRWVIFLPWAAQTANVSELQFGVSSRVQMLTGGSPECKTSSFGRPYSFLFSSILGVSADLHARRASTEPELCGRAHFPGFAAGIEIKFSGLGKKNRARFSRLWKGKKRRANRNFLSSVLSLNHCLVFGGKVQNITRSTLCGYWPLRRMPNVNP